METSGSPEKRCRRERKVALEKSPDEFAPVCHPDGSFDPIQCKELMCYCVDSNGKVIEGTEIPRPNRPDCEG